LVTSRAVSIALDNVAVAVGRAAEHVDRSVACGVLFSTPAAFHDLGTLVLGNHPLDLKQEILLGIAADGIVQKDHLHAATPELLDDQHLISIFAREAIRRMNIEAIEDAGRGLVTKTLKRRPD
jgi:hypothetical protein